LYDWERFLGEYMVSHEQYPDMWVLPSSVHTAQQDFSAITRLTLSDDKIEGVVFFGNKYIAPLAQQQFTIYLYQPNSYDIAAYFTLNAYSTETTTENAYRLILEGGD
jgi:protoheme ferro-lyase